MIIGGDFNQVLDGALDKTTFSNIIPKDRMAIGLLMEDMGLIEIWRLVNPRDKEYTFYSHKHKSQSRIDYFLISKELVNNVTDCSIGPIALTDHAAVHLGVMIGVEGNRGGRWRMNVSVLQDPAFCTQLEKDINTFFSENIGSTDRIGTVWEASKAYIRRRLIAQCSAKKREQTRKLKYLETQLKDLEKELAEKHTDVLLKDICDLKFQINDIYNRKAEYALFRLKNYLLRKWGQSRKVVSQAATSKRSELCYISC